jgi:hypothetical protein
LDAPADFALAADLFERAAKATPTERSDLLKQAADLLAPAAK